MMRDPECGRHVVQCARRFLSAVVCVLVGMLKRICAGHWSLIGPKGGGLRRLVQKFKVVSRLSDGLEAGLRR